MKQAKGIRVLCVDDHPIVREGMAAMIECEDDVVSIGEAGDGKAAIEQYRKLKPDVVVMDLRMPGLGGVEATTQIRREFPAARIIVLTTYEGDEDIHRALDAGARGYLLKDMVAAEVLNVIRTVHGGRRGIPHAVAAKLAEHTPRVPLTPRETEVLSLVANGLSNAEVAARIGRTEGTVKVHLKNILH